MNRNLLSLLSVCTLALVGHVNSAWAQHVGERSIEITQLDVSDFSVNHEITIYFKVKDKHDNPSAVSADEVRLLENGKAVEIVSSQGFGEFDTRTILVVDVSGSMSDTIEYETSQIDPQAFRPGNKLEAAQASCGVFFDACRQNDMVGLVHFSNDVTLASPLGTSSRDMKQVVDSLEAGGRTVWRDALYDALKILEKEKGRRTILFLSDGQDTGSQRPLEEVLNLAKKLQVQIHTVGFGKEDPDDPEKSTIDAAALREVADLTGGECLIGVKPSKLKDLYQKTGSSAKEEMSITYRSREISPDGLRRKLKLEVAGAKPRDIGWREPHMLTIFSSWGLLATFGCILFGAWVGPWLQDVRVAQRELRARELAFVAPEAKADVAAPKIDLQLSCNPVKVPVSQEPRIVSLRLDATAEIPPGAEPLWHPLYAIVLLDLSASMDGQRLEAARRAIESFLDGLSDDDSFCLIGFSDDASLIVPPSRVGTLRSRIRSKLATLRTSALTRLAPALEMLKQQLPSDGVAFHRKPCVLILSDGKLEDSASSIGIQKQLADLNFSAFGIGYDYDHNVLATLCGGKAHVEHLPTAEDASHAFSRFLKMEGQTISANTSIRLDMRPNTQIDEFHLVRLARRLDPSGNVPIDNLSPADPVSLVADIAMLPTTPGSYVIGEATLAYDLPSYGMVGKAITKPIQIQVTENVAESTPEPHVLQGLRTIRTGKLAESVEEDVAAGEFKRATRKLLRFTQILESEGETEQAREMEDMASKLDSGVEVDHGVKDIRRLTQRLTRSVGTDRKSLPNKSELSSSDLPR